MDETEALITQLGLLLTQTRFARRALEDIERATSNYGTFAFTSVIAAGPRFGEPPLFDGALKVHVVNISDLAPGGGFGDFLQGLLGGVGSFLGNLPGGLIGGTISSIALVNSIPTIHALAGRIERILQMIGIGAPPKDAKPGETPATGRGAPVAGSNLLAQLDGIRRAVDSLTGLFLAASGKPDQAAGVSTLPSTPQGERWQRLLDSASVTLAGIGRVVDGLIIALPVVVGSIAWLISKLGDFRLAIAETLRFALRNTLLLRGAIAVTAFDTLAMVARMAATVVGILASTLDGILSAVFDTIGEALLAVLELGAVLGDAVKSTVDKLLDWLVPTVDAVLRNLADLRAFRVLTHVVRILPAILPPIFELAKDRPLGKTELTELRKAGSLSVLGPAIPGAGGATPPPPPPPAPNFRAILTDPAVVGRMTGALDRMRQVSTDGLRIVGDTAQTGLRALGGKLDSAAVAESKLSDANLNRYLGDVRTQSTALADNLIVGEKVRPQTGLEAIATAYEGWLTGGGLNTLLNTITTHFSGPPGSSGIPQRVVEGSMDRPRATVQIDEVVIEVEGAPPPTPPSTHEPWGPGDFPLPPERDDMERYARMRFDHDRRGGSGRLPIPT